MALLTRFYLNKGAMYMYQIVMYIYQKSMYIYQNPSVWDLAEIYLELANSRVVKLL